MVGIHIEGKGFIFMTSFEWQWKCTQGTPEFVQIEKIKTLDIYGNLYK